jgi:succinyl-CoA synthetase beta subunit
MLLYEYQGKELLRSAGIETPKGILCRVASDAADLPLPAVVKAQVRVGGRGKAGAIQKVASSAELERSVLQLLGSSVKGHPVGSVLVEPLVEIDKEWYLAIAVDRSKRSPVLLVSGAGGVDVEESEPEDVLRIHLDHCLGLQPYMIERVIAKLGAELALREPLTSCISGLWNCFVRHDCEIAEINPLVLTQSGALIALDARIGIDDRARFRQPKLDALVPLDVQEGLAGEAARLGVFPVFMSGDIAVIAGGAGTLMASFDYLASFGATLAGGVDLGGFGLRDQTVLAGALALAKRMAPKVLLFNSSYMALSRGDEVAETIINAGLANFDTKSLIVRMAGNRSEEGRRRLVDAGIRATPSLVEACRWAVQRLD